MPTATTTITKMGYTPPIPLRAAKPPMAPESSPSTPDPPAHSTTDATLRTLYHRAATSFLHRDVTLTSSLIQSAFTLLQPPVSHTDALSEQRRKWDILRITLESTLYMTPPPSLDDLPESLRRNHTESPQSLMMKIYNRSLALFTPSSSTSQKAVLNAACLPPPVLVTLVYASLKVDSPDAARNMIEDWLARRESSFTYEFYEKEGDGYEKILELYCLHILPKLEQWDYAKEFLQYETELPVQSREQLENSLQNLRVQVLAARRPSKSFPGLPTSPFPSSSSTPRPYSPAPSASSSSSSLSTTSTHTIVPSTPRPNKSPYTTSALASHVQSSSTSLSSDTTATPNPRSKGKGRSRSHTRRPTSSRSSGLSLPRSNIQTSAVTPSNPTTYALIKASLAPYLTTSRISTFIFIVVLLPLVSFVLRLRRRRRLLSSPRSIASSAAGSNVELVRRRLQVSSETGIVGRIWGEAVRAVVDTVKMAGSGLV
ncbi:hypothetical protein BDQ17DRAFT_1325906 [Cyathus striatus]|nr:hypothetical protein BDQ17DRAFT_1325906 [Cyathus striatus]